MVIYVSAIDSDAAASLVRTALTSLSAHDTPVSVFTHHVGDRLALAMEPRDPRPAYRGGLSFGQHRSRYWRTHSSVRLWKKPTSKPLGLKKRKQPASTLTGPDTTRASDDSGQWTTAARAPKDLP